MAYGKAFTARRRGTCAECGGNIKRGEQIQWDHVTRTARHAACADTVGLDRGLAGMTDVDRMAEDLAAEVTREY